MSSTCPHNMAHFGPLAAENGSGVWGTPANFNLIRHCTLLSQWASAKLCGVGQRAPAIFGRAAITFGIGPHSSYYYFYMYAMNQHAKYLGRRSFRSKVTVRTRPLRWSVIIERFHQLVSHERGTKRGFSLRLKCFSRGHRPPR